MRTRILTFFLGSLTLLLPGWGWGQPPDEPLTPEEVVRAFLARAEAQEWDPLAELCTSESQTLLDRFELYSVEDPSPSHPPVAAGPSRAGRRGSPTVYSPDPSRSVERYRGPL